MSYEENLRRYSFPVAASIPIYTLVAVDSNGNVAQATAGGAIDGVVQDDNGTASGLITQVGKYGISKAICGATPLSAGTYGQSDANGNVVPYTSGTSKVRILQSASPGDIFPIFIG
jgi:hypothetical protein